MSAAPTWTKHSGQPSTVLCGTWTGQRLLVDSKLHLGAWVPINGMWGECRTDCGIEDRGYLTAVYRTNDLCPKCFEGVVR